MKKNYLLLLSLLFISLLSACSSARYYLDAANGHFDLLNKARPVDEVLQQLNLDEKLRQQLITFQQARNFASEQLHLPDNDSYRSFSAFDRDYVVWNVVAAEEFSTQPRQWCFLMVGCLSYRGYFEKEKVESYAEELKQQGLDVYISGVSAYSTLGWFDDPIVSSMLYGDEARRVGIMFHELAHQVMYRKDSTTFNESFAMVVEEEGIRRWFEAGNKPLLLEQYKKNKEKNKQFHDMLLNTKNKLEVLYEQDINAEKKRQIKRQHLTAIKNNYTQLRQQWNGYSGYDKWMAQELNNAHFLLVQTYHDLVPMFRDLLKKQNNNLQNFYRAAKKMSELDDNEFDKLVPNKF